MGNLSFVQGLFSSCAKLSNRGPVVVPITLVSNQGDGSGTISTGSLQYYPPQMNVPPKNVPNPPGLPRGRSAYLAGSGKVDLSISQTLLTDWKRTFSMLLSQPPIGQIGIYYIEVYLKYYDSDGVTIISETNVRLSADSGLLNELYFVGSPVFGNAEGQYLLSFGTPNAIHFEILKGGKQSKAAPRPKNLNAKRQRTLAGKSN